MSIYAAVPEHQRDVFHEYVSYAFAPEEGPPEYDPEEHDTPRNRLGSMRGIYDDVDDLESGRDDTGVVRFADNADPPAPRAVCKHYWFRSRVRGQLHETPGLSAVATPPEHRRRGAVKRLLRGSLEEYRARGSAFAVLWPFSYAFYNQYGWDTTNEYLSVECTPSDLAFTRDRLEHEGTYRRLEAEDCSVLDPVYEYHASRYDLCLERSDAWWQHGIFERWTTDPFVYVWERNGEPAGYVVYTITGDWGDRTVQVGELAYTDLEAFSALLSFCHGHDSQAHTVTLRLPVDTPLFDMAPAVDDFEVTRKTGPMVRIVDVERTLASLEYPTAHSETHELTLEVTDPLLEWNTGTYTLEVSAGETTCRRITTEAAAVDPVTVDIATLSQLAVGARSASALERAGKLTNVSEQALETLETLFPARTVFLDDGF